MMSNFNKNIEIKLEAASGKLLFIFAEKLLKSNFSLKNRCDKLLFLRIRKIIAKSVI